MPAILLLFELLGIGIRFARFAAFFVKIAKKSEKFIQGKLFIWFKWILKTVSAGGAAAEGVGWAHDALREWLLDEYGIDIDELEKEEILDAAGRLVADEMHREIYNRYGLEFPIENVRSETMVEDLSVWFADIINANLSKKLGYEVSPFDTLLPADNIPEQLDSFVSEAMTNALGFPVNSVLDVSELKEHISDQFFNVVTEGVNEAFHVAKSELTIRMEAMVYESELPQSVRPAVHALMVEALNVLALNASNLLPANIRRKKFYYSPNERYFNKLRQRKWRKTHKQESTWVAKAPDDQTTVTSILDKIAPS